MEEAAVVACGGGGSSIKLSAQLTSLSDTQVNQTACFCRSCFTVSNAWRVGPLPDHATLSFPDICHPGVIVYSPCRGSGHWFHGAEQLVGRVKGAKLGPLRRDLGVMTARHGNLVQTLHVRLNLLETVQIERKERALARAVR